MAGFRDLKVWQRAMEFAELVYGETKEFPAEERYGLVSQMRRAAVSVPSNLAEGEGRVGKDGRRFLDIAYDSILELETQIELSLRLGFITADAHRRLINAASETARMLNGLKSARDRKLNQVSGIREQVLGEATSLSRPETPHPNPDT